jgi:glyoxylase-like metal-dependent hydrolase (beta-lactamase superfamily II)/uncharacterized protein (DUF983 family)
MTGTPPPSLSGPPPILKPILLGRCPQCTEKSLFSGLYRMKATCDGCGYPFLREDGYTLGSLVLSYFGTSIVMISLLVWLLLIAKWELLPTLLVCSAAILGTNPLIFRLSRAAWLTLDYQISRRGFENTGSTLTNSEAGSAPKESPKKLDPKARLTLIDCDYVHPEFAGAYLLQEAGEAAFIETNTTPAVPRLLATLERAGLKPEAVRYLIVTHVHLDHAGGTSALLAACPNATVLAHPRASRHLVDPSRLVTSARAVYGDEVFNRLYGRIDPIPASRVRSLEDQATVPFGRSELLFLHTRGHAKHHFCVLDPLGSGIFTGDSFGLRYPRLQRAGLFLFPSTSPTDFEPEEARKSITRIARSGALQAHLTHFGSVRDLLRCESLLLEGIDLHEKLLLEAAAQADLDPETLTAQLLESLRKTYSQLLGGRGWNLSEADLAFLDLDLRLNAAGLVHAARTRTAAT